MITFVHLSDIHFSPRDDLSQFDVDQQIRRALLEDLELKPADGEDYDGLLITGDIAFAGKPDDYQKAQAWLNEVYERTGTAAANTYTVPGNHDVDRSYVEPEFPLFASHSQLRAVADPVVWRDVISKQLQRDPLHSMLAPLTSYNDFAQGYDCRTQSDRLAWNQIFNKKLDDGRLIRLHGLNSAFLSDRADAPGNLLVSEFQTAHFAHEAGVINVVLCHHPPEWLMPSDKVHVRNALGTFASIALFGHEHSTRIVPDGKQVQLFAGAVQPSRRDPGDWLPTYHIVQLRVAPSDTEPKLVVRIHTREYNKDSFKFRPRRNEREETVEQHQVAIPVWKVPVQEPTISITPDGESEVSSPTRTGAMPAMPTPKENAQRELLVNFFRLGTPDRYAAANEAGLLQDGDDALPPQIMWAEVFRRAVQDAQKLTRFWSAVASRTPKLRDTPNPFAA
jgi:predicted MPP superfamily phosphohydrolase